jgi:hypothetical protein
MRHLRVYLGLALLAVSILASVWAVTALARYGSCASGGVYVSARECAPGTGLKIFAITGGVFAGLLGMALTMSARAGFAAPALIFGMLASYFYVTALGADLSPAGYTSNSAAIIAAVICTLIALPFIFFAVRPSPPDNRRVTIQGVRGMNVNIHSQADSGPAAIVLAGGGAPGGGGGAGGGGAASPFAAPRPGGGPSPFTAAASSGGAGGNSALAQQLAALEQLRTTGVIDDADFERGKRKLLGG